MISLDAWIQIAIFVLVLALCAKPVGLYLSKVLNPSETTFLDPILKPLENWTNRRLNIDPLQEQTWKEYLISVLSFSLACLIITMLILLLQPFLPFNPQHLPSLSWDLAFNTAISFVTNTNWQSYSAETTVSYFSQMAALTVQNFLSPAVGLGVSATLVRALSRHQMNTIGNFWVDLIRSIYYLFIPLAIVLSIIFIGEGIPQNFSHAIHAQTLEGNEQIIAQGPVASQESIKLLGTNGGGFFNANSAHPYENPTPFSNFLQMLAVLLIPAGQIYYFGHEAKHKKHAWSIFAAVTILLIAGAWLCIWSETSLDLPLERLGLVNGNMEGKEQRFGTLFSALYTSIATDSSCGAVDSNFDSLTPLGGLVPIVNMLFSEAIFGGCGSGLYSLLIYVIVTIFFAGLIIGRTPEYMGQKIEAIDIKLSMTTLLVFGLTILSFTAFAVISQWGLDGIKNNGPHGFSEIFYAYTSTAANNGSAFSGLSSNTSMYNVTLGLSMLAGRFGILIPVLALSGSLISKKKAQQTPTNLVVHGAVFTLFLLTILLLFGALMFLPALAIGPILEQILMYKGNLF